MRYINYTEKLLGLEGVIVKKVFNNTKTLSVMVELPRKPHSCPCCNTKTDKIHDYRKQVIKDIPAFGKPTVLILRKRRYACTCCGKRFFEVNTWLPRYYRMTKRLVFYIINRLSDVLSFTSLSKEVNLSVSTIIRIFDVVDSPKPYMPEVLSIDEFKGNTNGEKYQCIITDPVNKTIVDILPSRYKHNLLDYFKGFDRSRTRYFVSDMWETYRDISKTYFKNAKFIVDKYHFVRQVIWAFEGVRKDIQQDLSPEKRRYFKRSKSLLNKQFKYLNDEQKQEVNIMLYHSDKLLTAYALKESFFHFMESKNKAQAKERLSGWILNAQNSGLTPFLSCAKTMQNWYRGILNTFDCPYTNGFTEGINNKIKVLKRNAYGYRNFERFRKRILHVFGYNRTKTPQNA
jgi:transposase